MWWLKCDLLASWVVVPGPEGCSWRKPPRQSQASIYEAMQNVVVSGLLAVAF